MFFPTHSPLLKYTLSIYLPSESLLSCSSRVRPVLDPICGKTAMLSGRTISSTAANTEH